MKASMLEWVTKADADLNVAARESRVRNQPNYDAVCFHSQQCVEKYLKAYLDQASLSFPKTHILTQLASLCQSADPTFLLNSDMLKSLTDYVVKFRYPGDSATKEDAWEALKYAKIIRKYIRQKLGFI